jgi:HAD superfamily hydrolase (TIGR01509 family)
MTTVTVSPRDLEAVFFDIGGTLVGPNLALLGTWLRAAGIACDDERVSLVEPFARRAHAIRREAVVGTPGIRGLYLEELIRHVWGDRPGDPALLQSAVDRTLATALAAGHAAVPVWNQVLPGVPEGLAALRARGLRLVAVSNSDGSAEAVLVATGLRDWFEAVIDSHIVGFSKPDPRLFDAARAVLGVQARNVAHVGDQYEADILGAHAAGIGAILIDACGFWPECLCPSVDSFDAAIAILTDEQR